MTRPAVRATGRRSGRRPAQLPELFAVFGPIFDNRRDAGRQLARALLHYRSENPLILALPRGGVPVGFEIALALGAQLEVAFVRKIGAPGQPELGIGAIVDGLHPQIVLNDDLVRDLGVRQDYIDAEAQRELAEIERRRNRYSSDRELPSFAGRCVIVVDDGIATGGTARAVLRAVSLEKAAKRVLAVPVAPFSVFQELGAEADDIVCLAAPKRFLAVGAHYADFTQTSDAEVIALLKKA